MGGSPWSEQRRISFREVKNYSKKRGIFLHLRPYGKIQLRIPVAYFVSGIYVKGILLSPQVGVRGRRSGIPSSIGYSTLQAAQ